MPDEQSPWVVKGVSDTTRGHVKGFAALNHMTMAQSIELLVSRGMAAGLTIARDPALGVLRDMPEPVLMDLARRVTEEIARRNAMTQEDRAAEEAERLRAIGLALAEPRASSTGDIDTNQMMAEYTRARADEGDQ